MLYNEMGRKQSRFVRSKKGKGATYLKIMRNNYNKEFANSSDWVCVEVYIDACKCLVWQLLLFIPKDA